MGLRFSVQKVTLLKLGRWESLGFEYELNGKRKIFIKQNNNSLLEKSDVSNITSYVNRI